jgi:hypothetical protein
LPIPVNHESEIIQLCDEVDYNRGTLQFILCVLWTTLWEDKGARMSNWVEREAKRNNRNLLIAGLVALAAGAVLLFFIYDEATGRLAHDEARKQDDFTAMYWVGAMLLFPLGLCLNSLRRMIQIQSTPVWKGVALYGNVEQIAAQVEQEEQMEASKYRQLTITRSWIIRRGPIKTSLWPMTALIWVYEKTVKMYASGIPTWKFHGVALVNRRGQKLEPTLWKWQAEAVMTQLGQLVPWAFFGYSDELADALKNDLQGFIGAVDTRRQQYSSKSNVVKSSN